MHGTPYYPAMPSRIENATWNRENFQDIAPIVQFLEKRLVRFCLRVVNTSRDVPFAAGRGSRGPEQLTAQPIENKKWYRTSTQLYGRPYLALRANQPINPRTIQYMGQACGAGRGMRVLAREARRCVLRPVGVVPCRP